MECGSAFGGKGDIACWGRGAANGEEFEEKRKGKCEMGDGDDGGNCKGFEGRRMVKGGLTFLRRERNQSTASEPT